MAFNTTRWRKHPQHMDIYATFLRPIRVLARRVNQASFVYPLAQLIYDDPDGGEGVYTDVKAGQLVGVYSSADVFKGFARVRVVPATNMLYINEISAGDIAFEDNDKLVVFDDYRLWSVIPRQTSTGLFYKDYNLVVSENTTHIPPIANIGPWYAGLVNPDTGLATVEFSAAGSYPVASSATSSLTYAWDVGDGMITVGSSTTQDITATFPEGQRFVECTIIDSNSKIARAVAAVLTCDPDGDYPPVPVQLESMTGTPESGWECRLRVLAEDVSDLLPGTAVILFGVARYGDESGFVNGYSGREHVLFVGWVTDEDPTIEGWSDDLVLTCKNALALMQDLVAFPQYLEHQDSPTSWLHLKDLTWWRQMVYLFQWHSTLALVADIERPSFYASYAIKQVPTTGTTLYDQLTGEAGRAWARFTCDKTGRCFVRRHPQLMTAAERAAHSALVSLGAADWQLRMTWRQAHRPVAGWVRGSAFQSSNTEIIPLLAIAPGDSPGQGASQPGIDSAWVADQTELNERLGQSYELQNPDTQNLVITLNHQGLGFDPAWGDVLEFTLNGDSNRRGYTFTNARFVVQQYDITHDPATGTTTEILTLAGEVNGQAATTRPVEKGEYQDQPAPPITPTESYEPPGPVSDFSGGQGPTIMCLRAQVGNRSKGVIARTEDLSAAAPVWTLLEDGLTLYGIGTLGIVNVNPIDLFLDPFDPDTAVLILDFHDVVGRYDSEGGVYINTAWKTGGSWTKVAGYTELAAAVTAAGWTSTSNLRLYSAAASMAAQGLFYIAAYTSDNDKWGIIRIQDYGETVDASPLIYNQYADSGTQNYMGHIRIAAGNTDPDWVFAVARGTHPWTYHKGAFYAAEWGSFPLSGSRWRQSWFYVNSLDTDDVTPAIFNGYRQADLDVNDDTEMYISGPEMGVYKTANAKDASPTFAAWATNGPLAANHSTDTILIMARNGVEVGCHASENGFVVRRALSGYDQLDILAADGSVSVSRDLPFENQVGWAGGWPGAASQFYAGASPYLREESVTRSGSVIYMTTDGGLNWRDLTGNLWSIWYYTGSDSDNKLGVVRLTPHWLE